MSQIGRPAIGRPVQCRYPAGLLDEIDAAAAASGVGRPEWLRRAARAALDAGLHTSQTAPPDAGLNPGPMSGKTRRDLIPVIIKREGVVLPVQLTYRGRRGASHE